MCKIVSNTKFKISPSYKFDKQSVGMSVVYRPKIRFQTNTEKVSHSALWNCNKLTILAEFTLEFGHCVNFLAYQSKYSIIQKPLGRLKKF